MQVSQIPRERDSKRERERERGKISDFAEIADFRGCLLIGNRICSESEIGGGGNIHVGKRGASQG